jgi:isopentenyl diphosphate isomerase/L-lactate dehydrogenase-like FMN-dependent dehydrogenase
MAYDYYASGANDEVTLRENRAAYERITLLPRMLVDVSVRDMGTTVLGEPVSMPILIAPTALPGLAHPEGEIATTKAAGAAKTLMTLATLSTSSIEEAMATATGPVWFQLYVFRDRAITTSLVQRAEAAGLQGGRIDSRYADARKGDRDVRNRFTLPELTGGSGVGPTCSKRWLMARAVLVGRPIRWGLAVGGEAGVKYVLEMLRQEFDLAMALSGCPSLCHFRVLSALCSQAGS